MRILICINNFRGGGESRTLQFFLAMVKGDGDLVDLFCLDMSGSNVPKKGVFRFLSVDKRIQRLLCYRKDSSISSLLAKAYRSIVVRLTGRDPLTELLKQKAESLRGYDVAIAWSEGYAARFVQFIPDSRRIMLVHNDYRFAPAGNGGDVKRFDRIVCVSHSSAESFKEKNPAVADRVRVIHNLLDVEAVRQLAQEPIADTLFGRKGKTLISVGRLDYPKHFDVIPGIARTLKQKGADFRWFIVGGGLPETVESMRALIRENEVEDCVILLGSRENPYPYVAASDIFVLTSRFECYPTVVNEALALGVPVLSSDIPVAKEMVSLENGRIEPYERMAEALSEMMEHPMTPQFEDHSADTLEKYQKLFDGTW